MDTIELQAVARCQAGELAHFTLLYERYLEKVYRFIYFKTYHRQTAEDLTSLTFMKALEKVGSYDAGKGRFSSWLYRIAQNTVIDHYRTAKLAANIDDIFNLCGRACLIKRLPTSPAEPRARLKWRRRALLSSCV